MTSKNEEEFRKLTVEIRLLEQTAETLQTRMNMINSAATDLIYARTALEELQKGSPNSDILVPIGGTSYIEAKLQNIDKIIVGMGAGVSVEKTKEEAMEIIKKRLEDLEKAGKSVQQQFSQVAERINQDREQAEALIALMKEGKTPQNV